MKERILRLCARGKIAINLRGMEYLQANPGEDEEAAWKRLRPKLSFTGRQLDEVFLLQPSAVPATGGTTSQITQAGETVGDELGVNSALPPVNRADTVVSSEERGIFGGDTSKPRVFLSNPATSPLNLIGKLESWRIGPATSVTEVTIKISVANGAQIKDLLKKLPDGMTFELTLEKESD